MADDVFGMIIFLGLLSTMCIPMGIVIVLRCFFPVPPQPKTRDHSRCQYCARPLHGDQCAGCGAAR